MMDGRKLMTVNDYGRVRIKLDMLLERKGMSRNALAKEIGSRFEVIDKWYGGGLEKLDLDVLARICYVLDCTVDDLLEYEAPN